MNVDSLREECTKRSISLVEESVKGSDGGPKRKQKIELREELAAWLDEHPPRKERREYGGGRER